MRSEAEIKAEIAALIGHCVGYDTTDETPECCVAVGAHDALRWALGLAEESVSGVLNA